MYRRRAVEQLSFEDFALPFGGKLRSDNRWVLLSKLVPWDLVEEHYLSNLVSLTQGAPALCSRVAFGALLVKEHLGVSDEEAVEQIWENPYLQYFLGYSGYREERPFDPSMYVHFRKRFTLEQVQELNEAVVRAQQSPSLEEVSVAEGQESSSSCAEEDAQDEEPPSPPPSSGAPPNQGKLVLDATCTPADIRYPTDVNLLHQAREKSEELLDVLFEPLQGTRPKPRTYRNKARRQYLAHVKLRKRSARLRRKAVGQQLRYVRRNLKSIAVLLGHPEVTLSLLSRRQYRDLLVIHELYRQQHQMYTERKNRIADRIVSISQPHVRPIVRGKPSVPTEFGAKLSASLVQGWFFLDRLDWNAYHEAKDLIPQVQDYRRRFGCYPASVHCDRIYRTRANRHFCKEHGIRISGPPLGRPPKTQHKEQQQLQRQDELDRIPIEGKFGQSKRRFSLQRVMTKLDSTSQTAIAITFLLINLENARKRILFWLFYPLASLQQYLTRTTTTENNTTHPRLSTTTRHALP